MTNTGTAQVITACTCDAHYVGDVHTDDCMFHVPVRPAYDRWAGVDLTPKPYVETWATVTW